MPHFGVKGQDTLLQARVLVVGGGGLGGPVAISLAAMGVGQLLLVDGDEVSLSNLHRQVYYKMSDLGKSKVACLKKYITEQNPDVKVTALHDYVSHNNIEDLLRQVDVVVDGSDNFNTRYLVNDFCFKYKKPLIYAALYQFEGQLTVFNVDNSGIHLRDLYPVSPKLGEIDNCNTSGVLGAVPQLLGQWQAIEVVKVITGLGSCMAGKLLVVDFLLNRQHTIALKKNYNDSLLHRMTYPDAIGAVCQTEHHQRLSLSQMEALLQERPDITLIDVRSYEEHLTGNLGGINIPLDQIHILVQDDRTIKHSPIIFYCKSGQRAMQALLRIQEHSPEVEAYYLMENG